MAVLQKPEKNKSMLKAAGYAITGTVTGIGGILSIRFATALQGLADNYFSAAGSVVNRAYANVTAGQFMPILNHYTTVATNLQNLAVSLFALTGALAFATGLSIYEAIKSAKR